MVLALLALIAFSVASAFYMAHRRKRYFQRLEAQQWREYCAGIRERYYNPAMTEAELAEMHTARWDGD